MDGNTHSVWFERRGNMYCVNRAAHESYDDMYLRVIFMTNNIDLDIAFSELSRWSMVWLAKKKGKCKFCKPIEEAFEKCSFDTRSYC